MKTKEDIVVEKLLAGAIYARPDSLTFICVRLLSQP